MKKTFNFIRKNMYIIFIIILYLLFFFQMQNVQLYSDDYTIHNTEFKNMINALISNWSGRIIGHSIVVGILNFFGIAFFKILQPIFLFLFCFLFVKIISIKIKINKKKLMFFITLFIMGFCVKVNSELLYWTYSSILYLWGYIPMLIILYFILDCHENNKEMTKFRFVVTIIFLIIINFMMESTMIFICLFLFFMILKKGINKVDKKLIVLFIITVLLLFFTIFIPGNINRLKIEQENLSFLSFFSDKIPNYFDFIINTDGISNIITLSSLFICIKNLIYKKEMLPTIFVLILNIVFFINFKMFDFMNFHVQSYIYILLIIYTILNIYLLFKMDGIDISYKFLIISGIITSLINAFLIQYIVVRFYFLLIISLGIFILKLYINENNKSKGYILLLYISLLNYKIGIICLIIYIAFLKNENKINLFLIILVFLNLFNFIKTIYYYYENSLIFNYNIAVIENAKKGDARTIYLKKIKHPDYACYLPEYYSYVMPWYKAYYEITTFDIIYIDPS